MLFAADKEVNKLTVFIGASLALIVVSGIGIIAGGYNFKIYQYKISALYRWHWFYRHWNMDII